MKFLLPSLHTKKISIRNGLQISFLEIKQKYKHLDEQPALKYYISLKMLMLTLRVRCFIFKSHYIP